MLGASEEIRVEHPQDNAMEVVSSVCSVFSWPVEQLLRPGYGTRYTPPAIQFFALVMMIVGPAIIMMVGNFIHMIPFLRVPPTVGMFSAGDFARLYFIASAVHGVRLWRRMLNPALEEHSEWEGRALPFFHLLPRSHKVWLVRVIYEPAFVLLTATVLQDFFIVQYDLGLYLKVAAAALFMKNFISWFRAWEYSRKLLDTRFAAPIMAKFVEDEATEEELAPMHLASLPKTLDPAIRKAAAMQIARAYSPDNPNF